MSDITISPIPYNNGSLASNNMQGHYVLLNPNMILHVAGQTNPNYIFAWVSTTTGNLKTGAVSFTAQPMRAIMSFGAAPNSIAQIRLYKLTSARALLQINFEFYVIEVSNTNDIVLKNARIGAADGSFPNTTILPNNNQTNFTGGNAGNIASTNINGSWLSGWNIRDNVVWFARRSSSSASSGTAPANTGIEMVRIVYNPTGDTLTATVLARLWCPSQSITGAYSYARTYVVSIPNSTKKLVYVRTQNNATTGGNISLLASSAGFGAYAGGNADTYTNGMSPVLMIDSANDQVTATNYANLQNLQAPSGATNVRLIVPHSETKWSVWYNTNQYRMVTVTPGAYIAPGGAITVYGNMNFSSATSSQVFPTPTTATVPYHAEALDANYFILFSTTTGLNDVELAATSPAGTHGIRIGRIVDNDIAQISPSTISGGGMGFTAVTYPVLDQDFLVRYDSETFLMFGRAAAGSTGSAVPVIRVLYQPGG
jgi:hypothetical protein